MSKLIPFSIPAGTGAATIYLPVDKTYTVLAAYATPSTATGCTSTLTLTSGSTDLGTIAIGAAVAAATMTAAVLSTTVATRKTIITEAIPLKIVVDARTNSAAIFGCVKLDECALQRD